MFCSQISFRAMPRSSYTTYRPPGHQNCLQYVLILWLFSIKTIQISWLSCHKLRAFKGFAINISVSGVLSWSSHWHVTFLGLFLHRQHYLHIRTSPQCCQRVVLQLKYWIMSLDNQPKKLLSAVTCFTSYPFVILILHTVRTDIPTFIYFPSQPNPPKSEVSGMII